MAPDDLTDEWLSEILGTTVSVTGTKRIGDGLVGMNLRLALVASDAREADLLGVPTSLIAKLPSDDPISRATGMGLRNYEREVKFYSELAPTLDIRRPRCFHADWTASDGEFVLLLEDLAPGAQGNQVTGCSTEHARVSVLELAKLHGPRWGDSTLDDLEWLGRRTSDDAAQLTMLWSMFLPSFMHTYRRYLTTEGAELIERFGSRLTDWIDGREGPYTVTHGDYRLDNLMFATDQGGYPVAAVDWQTPGQGLGATDVSYFLGAGPLVETRREIERGLVRDYGAALAGYGVAVDDAKLWHQYARDAYAGILMSVIASQIVGSNERSEAMFAAMATRHTQHALDLESESLL